MSFLLEAGFVALMEQRDIQADEGQVPPGRLVHGIVELEADGSAGRSMPLEPVERVARACERVDDDRARHAGCPPCQRGDVASDQIGQPVPCAFHRSACQQPDAARVPVLGLQSVDGDVVGVAEAVAAVALDFPQREDLVALLFAEQEIAIEARHL